MGLFPGLESSGTPARASFTPARSSFASALEFSRPWKSVLAAENSPHLVASCVSRLILRLRRVKGACARIHVLRIKSLVGPEKGSHIREKMRAGWKNHHFTGAWSFFETWRCDLHAC